MFIPLGDDNATRRSTPVVVPILIALNILGWFIQLNQGDPFTYGFSFVPAEISRGRDLIGPIRLTQDHHPVSFFLYPSPRPLFTTVISAMFMHGSWGHLLGNMLYLWIFGDQIEDRLGRVRFLGFYLACGIAATAAHYFVDPGSPIPCLGASGAIAGVLGAYIVTHPQNRVAVLFFRAILHIPAFVVLGVWFGMQVIGQFGSVVGSSSIVAYAAHLGGFIAGSLGIFVLRARRRPLTGR